MEMQNEFDYLCINNSRDPLIKHPEIMPPFTNTVDDLNWILNNYSIDSHQMTLNLYHAIGKGYLEIVKFLYNNHKVYDKIDKNMLLRHTINSTKEIIEYIFFRIDTISPQILKHHLVKNHEVVIGLYNKYVLREVPDTILFQNPNGCHDINIIDEFLTIPSVDIENVLLLVLCYMDNLKKYRTNIDFMISKNLITPVDLFNKLVKIEFNELTGYLLDNYCFKICKIENVTNSLIINTLIRNMDDNGKRKYIKKICVETDTDALFDPLLDFNTYKGSSVNKILYNTLLKCDEKNKYVIDNYFIGKNTNDFKNIINSVVRCNKINLLKTLINKTFISIKKFQKLGINISIKYDYIEIFDYFRKLTLIDLSFNNNEYIVHACSQRSFSILKHITTFVKSGHNPKYKNIFTVSSKHYDTYALKILLSNKYYDPTADDYFAIKYTAEHCFERHLFVLLNDHRVDPFYDNCIYAIRLLLNHNGSSIFMLLTHPNFNIKNINRRTINIIIDACDCRHINLVIEKLWDKINTNPVSLSKLLKKFPQYVTCISPDLSMLNSSFSLLLKSRMFDNKIE